MDNSANGSRSGGIGFCGLLTIVFIVLKLCKVITWRWWWVLAPIWMPLTAILTIVFCIGGVALIVFVFEHFASKRRRR